MTLSQWDKRARWGRVDRGGECGESWLGVEEKEVCGSGGERVWIRVGSERWVRVRECGV